MTFEIIQEQTYRHNHTGTNIQAQTEINISQGGVQYKTPQQLFESFQEVTQQESKQQMLSPVAVNFPRLDVPITKEEPLAIVPVDNKLKPRGMQSNIISPSLVMKPASISHAHPPTQNATLSSKPLLVQGHANPNPCYYMDQNGSYVGYAPQFQSYPYGIYGMSPSYVDPRYLYPQKPNIYQKKERISLPVTKDVKTIDPVQQSSMLRQSFASIQGQMAANQIPLCLVQDSQGQLHQLVYTVPENLYEQYIAAAKNGFKVRVQPHLDSLKIASTANGSNKTPKFTDLDDENIAKSISADDLKLVKDIVPSVKHTSNANENNNNKIKEMLSNDITMNETKDTSSKTKEIVIIDETPKIPNTEVAFRDSTTRCPECKPRNLDSTVNSPSAIGSEVKDMVIIQDVKPCTQSPANIRENANQLSIANTSTPYEEMKASVTKEFLENIAQNRNSRHLNNKHSYNAATTNRDLKNCNSYTSCATSIATGLKETPINLFAEASPASTLIPSPPILSRNDCSPDISTTFCYERTNTKNYRNEQEKIRTEDTLASHDELPSPTSPSTISKDISHNITTIDDILSRNCNELIPKSDVESLLRCLKRKLELSEPSTDEESNARQSKIVNSLNNTQPKRFKANLNNLAINSYHLKSSSFDYDSLDMLSPEGLSDEGSPCSISSSLNGTESVSTFDITSNDSSDSSSPTNSNYPCNKNDKKTEIFDENNLHNMLDKNDIEDWIFEKQISSQQHVGLDVVSKTAPNIVRHNIDGNSDIVSSNNTDGHPDIVSKVDFDIFDHLKYDLFDNESFLCPEILSANTINDSNTTMVSSTKEKNKSPKHTNKYTEIFSFPGGHQGADMDLFDHLWNELETH